MPVAAGAVTLSTTIDFNAGPEDYCLPSLTRSGVTFSAVDGLGVSRVKNFDTPNGTPGLIGCNDSPMSPIKAEFKFGGVREVSVDLGDFKSDDFFDDTIFLRVYDASGSLLAATSLFLDGFVGMTTLSVTALHIDYAIFGSVGLNGSSVYADNFTFTRVVSEPPTLVLLCGVMWGALLLGSRRRASFGGRSNSRGERGRCGMPLSYAGGPATRWTTVAAVSRGANRLSSRRMSRDAPHHSHNS
jgi:hypothetical protein